MSDKAGERFVSLVAQMGDELEHARGWQRKVAKRLGVTQAYVSMVHTGNRLGGGAAIESAIHTLGIDPDFFYGDFAETPHYRAFMPQAEAEHLERPEPYPALAAFLESAEGRSCTPAEVKHLRSMRFRDGEPRELTYHYEVMKLRSILTPQQASASSSLMEQAEKDALARGGRKVAPRRVHRGG